MRILPLLTAITQDVAGIALLAIPIYVLACYETSQLTLRGVWFYLLLVALYLLLRAVNRMQTTNNHGP